MPATIAFSCLNPGMGASGHAPVLAEIARRRPTWSIPWFEGDGGLWHLPLRAASVSDQVQAAHATLDATARLVAADGGKLPLVVMGRSLGSAPAIELASSRPGDVAALVVESGFARIIPLLELLGIPARRFGVIEGHGPRNLEKMEKVSLPTLILHAENDTIIPIEDAEMLFAASRDPAKALLRVADAGHNDIQFRAGRRYLDAIRALLGRLSGRG